MSEIAAGCRIEPEGKAWVDDTIIVQSLTEGLWHSRVQLHAVSQMLVLPTINSKLPSVYRQIPVPPLTGKGQHRMGIRQLLHQSRDATLGGSTGYHHLERKPFTSCACMYDIYGRNRTSPVCLAVLNRGIHPSTFRPTIESACLCLCFSVSEIYNRCAVDTDHGKQSGPFAARSSYSIRQARHTYIIYTRVCFIIGGSEST